MLVGPAVPPLTVDLSDEINVISGDNQKVALAQIVFTILAFSPYDSVSFRIDGTAIDTPTDGANRAVVRAKDYKFPLNPG